MIIGTAGHIDHGKSALVTALTGRSMDRLAEEQRRGITIDLNFAPLRFDGLPPAGIVDVPGHEDFVRTMVAGASGIDLVLLVVDAAQGAQPQTWEHLAIVEQLRIPRGLPVLTKADLADPDWIELVASELMTRLDRSPVRFETPAIVSAVTGQGIAELRERLRQEVARDTGTREADAFRMPIDRVFSLTGVGTVVTGTPWSGTAHLGDQVRILPAGRQARVRSLEAYGSSILSVASRARTAVGLAGAERAAIARGDVLVSEALPWQASGALDARVELLDELPPLRRRARVRVHLGTAEVLARVYPSPLAGIARLALESPIVARGGDRFVLRSYSPVTTIGGGEVLDPLPPRRTTWPADLGAPEPVKRLAALISRRPGGILTGEAPILLGISADACAALVPRLDSISAMGARLIARSTTVALRSEAVRRVEEHHGKAPAENGVSLETLRRSLKAPADVVDAVLSGMARRGELVMRDGVVSMPGFEPRLEAGEKDLERVLAILESRDLMPPTIEELAVETGFTGLPVALRFAAGKGLAVPVESNRYFSPVAINRFLASLREIGAGGPFTPPEVRDKTGLSRKYLIPLLEYADRLGVTRRVGDARVLVR